MLSWKQEQTNARHDLVTFVSQRTYKNTKTLLLNRNSIWCYIPFLKVNYLSLQSSISKMLQSLFAKKCSWICHIVCICLFFSVTNYEQFFGIWRLKMETIKELLKFALWKYSNVWIELNFSIPGQKYQYWATLDFLVSKETQLF